MATHAATRSRVVRRLFRADDAGGTGAVRGAGARVASSCRGGELRDLEDESGLTQQTFDTRTVVAIEPGSGPDSPLVGHVMAFGGFLRKCFVFDFSTEVDGAADEPVLSSRLAYARARILGGLELDPFAACRARPARRARSLRRR